MINLCLAEDFSNAEYIKCTFSRLAKRIYENLSQNTSLQLEYRGYLLELSEDSIFEFLLAKDFYEYKFIINQTKSSSISQFLSLQPGNAVSSITSPRSKANAEYKKFHLAHLNTPFMQNIKNYYSRGKLSNRIKKEFICEIYPEYFNIKDIFSYELIKTHRTRIMQSMDVSVCPYCNMNYVLNFQRTNGADIASSDLDHFYVKSKHPEYTLCLFNFIPSCQVCNSRLKGCEDMNVESYIYPHNDISSHHITFKLLNLVNSLSASEHPYIDIENKTEKADNSNTLFEIKSRYNAVSRIAKDLLDKSIIYNESYNDELVQIFGDIDVKTLVFGKELNEKEILNTSLGKLKNDLLKQFGIF